MENENYSMGEARRRKTEVARMVRSWTGDMPSGVRHLNSRRDLTDAAIRKYEDARIKIEGIVPGIRENNRDFNFNSVANLNNKKQDKF